MVSDNLDKNCYAWVIIGSPACQQPWATTRQGPLAVNWAEIGDYQGTYRVVTLANCQATNGSDLVTTCQGFVLPGFR